MLQFIAEINQRYSLAESVQMVIEGDCRWVQLRLPDAPEEEIREMITDIITMCRESGSFLTIEDRPDIAKETGMHGVYLSKGYGRPASAIREELGAEAVIGVEVSEASSIIALAKADIDYVALDQSTEAEKLAEIIAAAREAGVNIPIVITGDITPEDAIVAMATGASGLATGRPIIEANDPVRETEEMIRTLEESRQAQ